MYRLLWRCRRPSTIRRTRDTGGRSKRCRCKSRSHIGRPSRRPTPMLAASCRPDPSRNSPDGTPHRWSRRQRYRASIDRHRTLRPPRTPTTRCMLRVDPREPCGKPRPHHMTGRFRRAAPREASKALRLHHRMGRSGRNMRQGKTAKEWISGGPTRRAPYRTGPLSSPAKNGAGSSEVTAVASTSEEPNLGPASFDCSAVCQHSMGRAVTFGVVAVGVVSTGVVSAGLGASARLAFMVPIKPIAKAAASNRAYANQRIVSMTGR